MTPFPDRLIRRADVKSKTSMTRYLIDLQESLGLFPKRIRVGGRAVFWSEQEVEQYIAGLRDRRSTKVMEAECGAQPDGDRQLKQPQKISG